MAHKLIEFLGASSHLVTIMESSLKKNQNKECHVGGRHRFSWSPFLTKKVFFRFAFLKIKISNGRLLKFFFFNMFLLNTE